MVSLSIISAVIVGREAIFIPVTISSSGMLYFFAIIVTLDAYFRTACFIASIPVFSTNLAVRSFLSPLFR